MLYRYTVSNFMSYKDAVELSMCPLVENISGHLITTEGDKYPALKTAVIYGANASGKSSLIKSMSFARSIILENKELSPLANHSYKLDKASRETESLFSFEIKIGKAIYQYGFSVMFSRAQIQEEWLYELTEDICIFHRERVEEKIFIKEVDNSLTEEEKSRLKIYEEDMSSKDNNLLLSEIGKKEFGESRFWTVSRDIYNWFKKLTIFFPNTRFNLLSAVYGNEKKVNDLYKEYFNIFGIEIDNIHLKEVPIEYLPLKEDILTEIHNDLKNKEKGIKAMLNIKGKEYLFETDEEGNLTAKEVKFKHLRDGYTAEFSKDEESDGTQRLFDLIPAYAHNIMDGGVIVIDEIDRNLHCLLTLEILKYFLSENGNQNRQLICTTHDVKMINLSVLRPDEIWFIDKKETGFSTLYPLARYKVEYPDNAEINYLNGMYNGIPNFNNLKSEK